LVILPTQSCIHEDLLSQRPVSVGIFATSTCNTWVSVTAAPRRVARRRTIPRAASGWAAALWWSRTWRAFTVRSPPHGSPLFLGCENHPEAAGTLDRPKRLSLLRFALCCTVLRSRWYQNGIRTSDSYNVTSGPIARTRDLRSHNPPTRVSECCRALQNPVIYADFPAGDCPPFLLVAR
jgi:hypothetical protein